MSTESRDYEFGRIVSVDVMTLGDNLAADAASGASMITVEDAADFDEDGGTLALGGVTYVYTACDDDTGVITLAGTLSAAAVEGDEVYVYDTQYLAVSTDKVAQVAVIGDDGSVDMLEAAIALHLVSKVPEGIRGNEGEAVKLELDGGEWVVVDIAGLGDPDSAGELFYEDSKTVTATGVQTLNLTYEPKPHSEHLYWNGVYQPGTEWSRVGQVVTVPDSPTGAIEVGDQLVMEYAYLKGIYAPPVPATSYAAEVLADNPEVYYRMGETGDYAAGPIGINNIGTNPIALNAISANTPNNGFTTEVGEPAPTSFQAFKTAWWTFTVPIAQEVRVDTQLTPLVGGWADTEMAVRDMTGGGWGTVVAASGDEGGNNTSLLTFAATTGVIYAVQVSAYNGVNLEYILRVTGNHLADSSGHARHGNYKAQGAYYLTRGVAGLVSGDADKAAQFTASHGCRGLVPYGSWMSVSTFTIEAIVATTDAGNPGIIAARGAWYLGMLNDGRIQFVRGGSVSNSTATSTASYDDGNRHLIDAVYVDGVGSILYVDGAVVATAGPAGTPTTSTDPLTIASTNVGVAGDQFFNGVIDEVAFYTIEMSVDRVGAHYAAMIGA